MADQTPEEQDREFQQREVLERAYGAVLGYQAAKQLGATTVESAVVAQLEALAGPGTMLRPTTRQRVLRTQQEVKALAEQLKKQPAEQVKQPGRATNT